MKKVLALAFLMSVVSAPAETCWVNAVLRTHRWSRPPAVLAPWGEYRDAPGDEFLARCNWFPYEVGCSSGDSVVDYAAVPPVRCLSEQELSDRAAAELAAQEAAAAMAGPAPEIFVPALDDEGNLVGTARLVVRAATWELVPLTNSASPQRAWEVQLAEFKGKIGKSDARKDAIRAAKAKGNGVNALDERVGALEAASGVE